MKNNQPTLEHALYGLALIIAVGLRFINLGSLALSDIEAGWALQAMKVAQGLRPAIGSNPAYVHLTAITFFIAGTANFLARFWPAIFGCLLVIAPWLLRSKIGRIPALILAFGLAIDPGLVAISHQAGGAGIAVTCLVLALLFWLEEHPAAAGFFAGLGLLGGPSFWFGLLGLTLARLFFHELSFRKTSAKDASINQKVDVTNADDQAHHEEKAAHSSPHSRKQTSFFDLFSNLQVRTTLLWGLGTWLVLGSLLVLSPTGLSGAMMSIVDFMRGWFVFSSTPAWKLLLALPAYEILPLGFGIAGLVRGVIKKDNVSLFLGIWALIGLILAFIHPGKETTDLVWVLLPLWILAALELSRYFDFEGCRGWEVAGIFILIFALLIFAWLDLASLTNMDPGQQQARMRIYLLLGVLLMIAISLVLVGIGWSWKTARLGGVWSFMFVLILFTIAMSTGAAGIRQPQTVELWYDEPRSSRLDMLQKVANQISEINTGFDGQIPITIINMDSPSLHWLFRDWQVKDVTALAQSATPEIVISMENTLDLGANYRGEPLPLLEAADWNHATSDHWLKWFIYRQIPMIRENIVFWVRSDFMLENQNTVNP